MTSIAAVKKQQGNLKTFKAKQESYIDRLKSERIDYHAQFKKKSGYSPVSRSNGSLSNRLTGNEVDSFDPFDPLWYSDRSNYYTLQTNRWADELTSILFSMDNITIILDTLEDEYYKRYKIKINGRKQYHQHLNDVILRQYKKFMRHVDAYTYESVDDRITIINWRIIDKLCDLIYVNQTENVRYKSWRDNLQVHASQPYPTYTDKTNKVKDLQSLVYNTPYRGEASAKKIKSKYFDYYKEPEQNKRVKRDFNTTYNKQLNSVSASTTSGGKYGNKNTKRNLKNNDPSVNYSSFGLNEQSNYGTKGSKVSNESFDDGDEQLYFVDNDGTEYLGTLDDNYYYNSNDHVDFNKEYDPYYDELDYYGTEYPY